MLGVATRLTIKLCNDQFAPKERVSVRERGALTGTCLSFGFHITVRIHALMSEWKWVFDLIIISSCAS
jgi:hypothetical protein